MLKKYIPVVVRMIFAPLLRVFIISALMLVVFQADHRYSISGGVANGINSVLALNFAIAACSSAGCISAW